MGILSIRNRFGLASLGVQVHSRGKSHPAGAAETGTWAGTWDDENASCRHVGIMKLEIFMLLIKIQPFSMRL